MKSKRLFSTPMIAVLILSVLSMVMTGSASAYPKDQPYFVTSPDPKVFDTDLNLTCTSFDIDVQLYNISAPPGPIAGYEFQMWYNSSFITATKCVPINKTDVPAGVNPGGSSYGPGKMVGPKYVWTPINNSVTPGMGRVWVIAAFPVGKTYSGMGPTTAIRVTFHIETAPIRKPGPPYYKIFNTTLAFNGTVLGDTLGKPIPHGVDDGFVNYKRQQIVPGKPVANFVFDKLVAYVCDTVTCTSTSTPNGGNIIAWDWTIAGPATNTTRMDQSVMQFHCDGPGTVNVTLTVWDDEGMSDSKTKQIAQVEKIGGIVDVYTGPKRFCGQMTPYVGKGLKVYADAYSPDVMVELFAEVTWNGKPVTHVLVAFEVLFELNETQQYPERIYVPLNACVTYRTNETNKDGIAKIRFRIPNPCYGPMFGKWLVIVSAKIQDIKYSDFLRFDVGYVITLVTLQTLKEVEPFYWVPEDTFQAPCEWVGFDILLKNIMWIEKEVTFVVVVYDDCDVPLGQIIVRLQVPAGEWCNPFYKDLVIIPGIHLPQWTYVGVGKVYVSAFTALPHECGAPYCPEISHSIILEWSGEV